MQSDTQAISDGECVIRNPILPGFNPDPCLCRRGDDFFLATSTFEWFPGVMIYHSRDIVNWRMAARPLDRLGLLDLRGTADCSGIWAPCLSYDGGRFWLVYTDSKYENIPNYLTTAPEIAGPWEERVELPGYGFDPSLFHDEDGSRWLLMMDQDRRPGGRRFAGILVQRYDHNARKVVGPVRSIFKGTDLNYTEGPHLYRHNGWYYLVVAEGGTGYGHAVTVARSRDLFGPYEVHPENPMLTSAHDPTLALQKAGHASFVGTPNGRWYLAHLCGRPLTQRGRCILGRETALQEFRWDDDGWPRLVGGGREPRVEVSAPALPPHPWPKSAVRTTFSGGVPPEFQSLRVPIAAEWASTTARRGWLRLTGRHSLHSLFDQSLLARRVQHFRSRVQTSVDFVPEDRWQQAGLVACYGTRTWYFLHIAVHDEGRRILRLQWHDQDPAKVGAEAPIVLPSEGPVHLRLDWDRDRLRFSWSADEKTWNEYGSDHDAGVLADDYHRGGFTGAMVGMTCVDLACRRRHADFAYFEYRPIE